MLGDCLNDNPLLENRFQLDENGKVAADAKSDGKDAATSGKDQKAQDSDKSACGKLCPVIECCEPKFTSHWLGHRLLVQSLLDKPVSYALRVCVKTVQCLSWHCQHIYIYIYCFRMFFVAQYTLTVVLNILMPPSSDAA